MRIGLVGLGAMGQNHARVLSELDALSSVFDVDALKSLEANKKYGAIPRDSTRAMTGVVDAVVIAAPTKFHLPIAEICINAGIPVLIEKPISNSVEEAKKIVALAESKNLVLAVGYIERFNPAFRALLGLVEQGYFGELICINIKRVGGDPRTADNVVLDLMTHDLDLLMSIFKSEPTNFYTHLHSNSAIVDAAQVLLGFGSASATCESNWVSPVKIREIHITGTKGCVIVDLIRQELTKIVGLSATSKTLEVHSFKGEPLKEELLAFMADVKDGEVSRSVSGNDAVRALETTLKVAGR